MTITNPDPDDSRPLDLASLHNHEIAPISAVEAISRAEVDIQISTAKRYPRQLAKVKSDMLSFATLDEETAESCFYSLPRGGKTIQGPSIRLAEIAVSCYGNIRAGTRIVDVVARGEAPHVIVQAICHDLQTNVAVTVEKRRRITKKKSKADVDEDDINLAANAGSAIAFRDAVYKVIPGALIRPVYEEAKKVAIGDAKTLADRRARAIEAFAKMGVTPDRILALLERGSVDEVTIADLETLFGLKTAIKDGQTTIDESFPPTETPGAKPRKPSFSLPSPDPVPTTQPDAQSETQDPIPTPEPEEKTPQDRILSDLEFMGVPEADFMSGLRKIAPGVLAKTASRVAQIPNQMAENLLADGVAAVIETMREAGAKL
jgi:hypothetical protein